MIDDESQRALRYLEASSHSNLISTCVDVLVTQYKDVILAECPQMIKSFDTKQLELMFRCVFFY